MEFKSVLFQSFDIWKLYLCFNTYNITQAILALSSVNIWRKEYECSVASEQAAELKIVFKDCDRSPIIVF